MGFWKIEVRRYENIGRPRVAWRDVRPTQQYMNEIEKERCEAQERRKLKMRNTSVIYATELLVTIGQPLPVNDEVTVWYAAARNA